MSAKLGAIAEIILCSSVPTQVALTIALQAAGIPPTGPDGNLSLPFVFYLSIGDTILLVGLMVLLMKLHGQSVKAIWLGSRPWLREAGLGVLLMPLVFVAVVVILNGIRLLAPQLHNVETNPLEQLANTPFDASLFAIVAIVGGGVREELQRAFLLNRFEQHLGGAAVGVAVVSFAFGIGHIVQGWDAVIATGVLGAFWAVLYLRRRSVIAPMVSHSGFNALEIVRVAAGLGE